MAAMHHSPSPLYPDARMSSLTFGDLPSAIVSTLLISLMIWAAWKGFRWAILTSEVRPDVNACRIAEGACWGALVEKARLILLGRFPPSEQWRPVVGSIVLLVCIGIAALPQFFGRVGMILLTFALLCFAVLLKGGVLGLTAIGTELWSGLPLTLLLGVVACLFGLPLGIMLALARRSKLPVLRWLATAYVEVVRGLP